MRECVYACLCGTVCNCMWISVRDCVCVDQVEGTLWISVSLQGSERYYRDKALALHTINVGPIFSTPYGSPKYYQEKFLSAEPGVSTEHFQDGSTLLPTSKCVHACMYVEQV